MVWIAWLNLIYLSTPYGIFVDGILFIFDIF